MKDSKKIAVIGLDCALTHLIDKHIAEGELPNFKKLFSGGTVCENALVPYPTITPPNWATIATGAYPGTHGITDFWVHLPGTNPTNDNTVSAFNSKWFQAETIWEAAERAGKKSIVFNYPGASPSKMKNAIVVGGRGLSVGLVYDGHKHLDKDIALCGDMLFTTDNLYGSVKVDFTEAENWTNINTENLGDEPLEAKAQLNFPHSISTFEPTTWYILVRETGNKGYDTITLSPSKNFEDAFFTLKIGEWSPKIFTLINADNEKVEVFFNAKLVALSDDVEDFKLYLNPMVKVHGWSTPPEIDDEIRNVPGVPGNSAGYAAIANKWIDNQTWIDINYQHSEYNGAVAATLLKNHEWDIFYMHSHPPDWTYHFLLTELDMKTASSESQYKEAWRLHLEMYKGVDKMLGTIMEVLDDDTIIVLVSDHGAVMDGPSFNPNDLLCAAGLMVMGSPKDIDTRGENKSAALVKKAFLSPDLSKSKAIAQRVGYVYVNLKSKYPDGIVEDSEYEKTQQDIIDALLEYRHPATGERAVSIALSKRDARLIGLHGDGIGDVVYAVKPEYASQHGNILPTATWGVGTLHALLNFYGPHIKKGQRLERTCNIADLVPTLCYIANLPVPKQVEGAVIFQVLDDMNIKLH